MTTEEVTCVVLVIKPYGNDVSLAEKSARVCLKDCPNTAIETRLLWARAITKEFLAYSKRYDNIRPWEFILSLDGTVECLAVPPSKSHHDKVYPARFRIPPDTLLGLGQEEKNKRSEMFALGSLLYEINSGNKPFEELSDDEVQLRFSNGDFPDDITSLQLWPIILSCWSLEFSKEVEKIIEAPGTEAKCLKIVRAAGNYIKEHPVSFTLQAVGVLAMTASVVAVPVLGAAGFAATGPVAGSAAAAWQSSIGLVEAGSLFSWCQSAAMSGAALNGIFSFGVAGAGVAGVATVPVIPGFAEKFKSVFRRGEPHPGAGA
ncbi:uncharacterized protein K441DRAFT_692846 [Cenococcum geophilum 1.58]|uniref:uncharacterized protein n=1 Tax=Cenococcum geophilum 1.58 TaxID=794803 RepID=UPI00358EB057|nr:hypothetical protein K441DRAFT_692846 [Cenococcum geophilum 1.58]